MGQVGGGMVGARAQAPLGVHRQAHALADRQAPLEDLQGMSEQLPGLFLGVEHLGPTALPIDLAAIARLAAAFSIEGCLVEQDLDGLPRLGRLGQNAVADQGQGFGRGFDLIIAGEHRRPQPVAQAEPFGRLNGLARTGPVVARHPPLAVHGDVKPFQIHGQPHGAHGVLGQVEREAVGVVEFEGHVPGDHAASSQIGRRFFQQSHAPAQGAAKALLLLAQGFHDHRLGADQFRIGRAHFLHQDGGQTVHQRILGAEKMSVAHGPAHDPAQHIAATLVGGRNAVGDQEAG